MGRRPCCSKEGLNRGAWTASEDTVLAAYIQEHGQGNWRNLPCRAGKILTITFLVMLYSSFLNHNSVSYDQSHLINIKLKCCS